MAGDPIQAMIDRAKQELTAVNQQIEAAQTTRRSLEDTLKTTQKQVADAQAQAAASSGKVADAEKRAREIVDVANRAAAASMDKAVKELAAQRAAHSAKVGAEREAYAKEVRDAEAKLAEAQQKLRDTLAATSVAQQKLDAIKRQASEFAKS